jgi:hypothetical protein
MYAFRVAKADITQRNPILQLQARLGHWKLASLLRRSPDRARPLQLYIWYLICVAVYSSACERCSILSAVS